MPCVRDVDSSVVIDSVGSGLRVRRIDGGQSVVRCLLVFGLGDCTKRGCYPPIFDPVGVLASFTWLWHLRIARGREALHA